MNFRWIITGLLALFLPLECYIYEIQILQKWDSINRRYQTIIGCSDYHDKTHEITSNQRAFLLKICAALRERSNMRVFVEDLSSPNRYGQYGCNQFSLASKQGILAGLTGELQQEGLDVENLEYRYSRVIGLGGMLSAYGSATYNPEPAETISIQALLSEIETTMRRIEHFDCDKKCIATWYQKTCADVARKLALQDFYTLCDLSCAQYVEKKSSSVDQLTLLKQLLIFDSDLFDCCLVEGILRAHDTQIVLALAGGTHIARAFAQLQHCGFKKVYATQLSFEKDYDVSRNVGSPIMPGGYCVKPQAIALDVLEKYVQ